MRSSMRERLASMPASAARASARRLLDFAGLQAPGADVASPRDSVHEDPAARWRFGLKRLFVATMEWLRLCPNAGPLPQIAQTFDIGEQCSDARERRATAGLAADAGAEAREDVGHLERRAGRVGALVAPSPAERAKACSRVSQVSTPKETGTPASERRQLEAARRLRGDVVEMRLALITQPRAITQA